MHARAAQASINFPSKSVSLAYALDENVNVNASVNDVGTNESSGRAATPSSSRRRK
jgi:hypothetical protein